MIIFLIYPFFCHSLSLRRSKSPCAALISAMENTGKSRKEFLKEMKFIIFRIHVRFNIYEKYMILPGESQD